MRIRSFTAAVVAALALAGAACGEDNESANPSAEPDGPATTDSQNSENEGGGGPGGY